MQRLDCIALSCLPLFVKSRTRHQMAVSRSSTSFIRSLGCNREGADMRTSHLWLIPLVGWCGFSLLFQPSLPVFAQQSAGGKLYTVEDLSVGTTTRARGPNLTGEFTAQAGTLHTVGRPFVKKADGQTEILGPFPGRDQTATTGINDPGSVAGYSTTTTSVRAFLLDRGGTFQDLGTLPGDNASQAFGLNNPGDVVGISYGPGGSRAFLRKRQGGMQSLGTLRNGDSSKAFAINNPGLVAGSSGKASTTRAFVWREGSGMQDLGTLPGDSKSEAYGINNQGDVVGYSGGNAKTQAFLWTSKEGMIGLGFLPGGTISKAMGINERGEIVGSSQSSLVTAVVGPRAFLWTRQNGMQDLNNLISPSLGIVLLEAVGINSRGQILALGRTAHEPQAEHPEGATRVFLLTP